ncbi:MAG: 1-acyl-sn-glycerol-3-phosphate acyltransferase [Myxococcales bacterium]|nr:1-acyl-sn-glycerol-3-phosphate acyltransferase [Myxococcales bacterium]
MRRYDVDSLDNRDPERFRRLVDRLEPYLWRYFRPVVLGLERIPRGAALYVGNHSGGVVSPDTYVLGVAIYRRHGLADTPYGLAHGVGLGLPFVHQLLVPIGAVRACHENAHRIFEAGGKVLVYPGGDIDNMRAYRRRDEIVFGSRRGYVRLALRSGVPIVPIVTAGSHATMFVLDEGRWLAKLLRTSHLFRTEVWPVNLGLPWGLSIGPIPQFPLPSRMFLEVLEPIRFERSGAEAAADAAYVERCHEQVLSTMQTALTALARRRRAAGGLMSSL